MYSKKLTFGQTKILNLLKWNKNVKTCGFNEQWKTKSQKFKLIKFDFKREW